MVVLGYLVFQQNSLPLQNKTTLIGRAPTCHIVFSHPSISKEHAIIEFSESDGAYVKDLNSLNGIYVNEKRVPKGGQTYLYNNASVNFGKDPIQYTFFFSTEFEKLNNAGPKSSGANHEKKPNNLPGINQNRDTTISLVDPNSDNIDLVQNTRSKLTPSSHQKLNALDRRAEENVQSRPQFPQSAGKVLADRPQRLDDFPPPQQQHQKLRQEGSPENQRQSYKDPAQEKLYRAYQTQDQTAGKDSHLAHHSELLELNERVLEKEEVVLKRENEINLYKNEIDSLRDECGKFKSKLHAVELYASELQRKNDLLTQEIAEKNTMIQEIQSTDLNLKAQLNINEVKSLRQILLEKDEEIGSLKRQLKAVLQAQSDPGSNSSHYEGFLEQQARELSSAKKQLQEFENRAEECKRRWNQLIKENINKEEKIKGLTFQLNRQIESYQSLYAENDRKMALLNSKFISMVSEDRDSQESQAAEFLVEQMAGVQEEREKIAIENEQLHFQIQELIDEVKRLSEEIQDTQQFFDQDRLGTGLSDTQGNNGIQKMKTRIEELEDLLFEMKQSDGAKKVTELNHTIEELERKLALQERSNQDLKDKLSDIRANPGALHDQGSIDFFSKLLEDKEQKIAHLKTQNDVLLSKEKQYHIEVEHLRDNVKQSTLQFENFKTRQARLESALSNKNGATPLPSSADQKYLGKQGQTPNIRFSHEVPFDTFEH